MDVFIVYKILPPHLTTLYGGTTPSMNTEYTQREDLMCPPWIPSGDPIRRGEKTSVGGEGLKFTSKEYIPIMIVDTTPTLTNRILMVGHDDIYEISKKTKRFSIKKMRTLLGPIGISESHKDPLIKINFKNILRTPRSLTCVKTVELQSDINIIAEINLSTWFSGI